MVLLLKTHSLKLGFEKIEKKKTRKFMIVILKLFWKCKNYPTILKSIKNQMTVIEIGYCAKTQNIVKFKV